MKLIILGAGLVGRLAKIIFPHAIIFESKRKMDIFNTNIGVNISIVPIPELDPRKYDRYIRIDDQIPSLGLISAYKKKIHRLGEMNYGDYRQFEPHQIVYKHGLPEDIRINYESKVTKINLHEKTLIVDSTITLKYDYLVSTIPLLDLIKITDLFLHFKEDTAAFFMHRPIYIVQRPAITPGNIIAENYLTDPNNPVYRENRHDIIYSQESLFKLENSFKVYPGKIYTCNYTKSLLSDLLVYEVICVGRYAEWNDQNHIWDSYKSLQLLKGKLE